MACEVEAVICYDLFVVALLLLLSPLLLVVVVSDVVVVDVTGYCGRSPLRAG